MYCACYSFGGLCAWLAAVCMVVVGFFFFFSILFLLSSLYFFFFSYFLFFYFTLWLILVSAIATTLLCISSIIIYIIFRFAYFTHSVSICNKHAIFLLLCHFSMIISMSLQYEQKETDSFIPKAFSSLASAFRNCRKNVKFTIFIFQNFKRIHRYDELNE